MSLFDDSPNCPPGVGLFGPINSGWGTPPSSTGDDGSNKGSEGVR